MTARLKYFIALVIVMTLIYIQQDFVIYAGEEALEPAAGQEELPGERESMPEGEDGEQPDDGGEQPPAEGGETSGGGEEQPPVEEEQPPVEEEKVIEEYEVKIPKADGKEGYYISKPEIAVKHNSEWGVTKYCLIQEDKKTEEKVLKEKGEKAVIEGKIFLEGKNVLHIWMEDEKGEKLKEFELKKEILVDTKAPEIHMSVPGGFESWYQGQVQLKVSGGDLVSGAEKITCMAAGKEVGTVNKAWGEFMIDQPSIQGKGTEVRVVIQDRAGNKSERVKYIYIDGRAPEIAVAGIKNYMITGKTADITCEVDEENMLQEYYAQITWENVQGKKKQIAVNDWKTDGTKRTFTQSLEKDGVYCIDIHAKDMSGREESKEMQIIIDKTDPVIRYVESLKGKYLKEFRWDYTPEKMFWDFTTYTYEIRMNGKLYHMGDVIDREGTHWMTVKVTDAAGNRAQSTAVFNIDHTAPEIIFHNVEEGEEYEEERTFKVELAGAEDTIRQIQINGENQKVIPGISIHEYSLDTCKDYEVTVKAADKAGNEAEKTIYFQIIPKKTLLKTIAGKVRTYENTAITKEHPQMIQSGEGEEETAFLKMAGAGILGILIALGAITVFIHKKSEAGRQRKQEDREGL